MNIKQQKLFVNDFLTYTGLNLEDVAQNIQPLAMTVAALINRTELIILTKIKLCNPSFQEDEATEYEKNEIKRALLEQVAYMTNVGDFSLITGYDPINNSLADIKELHKRRIAPLAKDILIAAGLLYKGVRRGIEGYAEQRRYWR